MRESTTDGLLLVDKPAGMTSHDVVLAARRAFGESPHRPRGHARSVRDRAARPAARPRHAAAAATSTACPRCTTPTIALGRETETDDLHGAVGARARRRPTTTAIADAIAALTGPLEQVPPAYSAKRVGGRRAYDAARAGVALELAPARVEVLRLARRGARRRRAARDDRRAAAAPTSARWPATSAPHRQRRASRRAAPRAERAVSRRRRGHRSTTSVQGGVALRPALDALPTIPHVTLERGRRRARSCAASPCRATERCAARRAGRRAERSAASRSPRPPATAGSRASSCGRSAEHARHRRTGARRAAGVRRRDGADRRHIRRRALRPSGRAGATRRRARRNRLGCQPARHLRSAPARGDRIRTTAPRAAHDARREARAARAERDSTTSRSCRSPRSSLRSSADGVRGRRAASSASACASCSSATITASAAAARATSTLLRALGAEPRVPRGRRAAGADDGGRAGEQHAASGVRSPSGDLDARRALLGRPYSLRGDGRRRATARAGCSASHAQRRAASPRKLLPPDGVYAVQVAGSRGTFRRYDEPRRRPTFGDDAPHARGASVRCRRRLLRRPRRGRVRRTAARHGAFRRIPRRSSPSSHATPTPLVAR